MAVTQKTITSDLSKGNAPVLVHRAFFAQLSVEAVNPVVAVELASSAAGPFEQTNFLAVPRRLSASVFAKRVENPEDPISTEITFEVRTRRDVTGQPQF